MLQARRLTRFVANRPLLARLCTVLVCALMSPLPANGFVVEAGHAPHLSPLEALKFAPRWSATRGSLVSTGERGLGGGLEIAIDPAICRDLDILDPIPCEGLSALILASANRWSEGHPYLRFVDVSRQVGVVIAHDGDRQAFGGLGAEIDISLAPASVLTGLHSANVAADARSFFERGAKVISAEGDVLFGVDARVTSADIRLNADMCFYLSAARADDGCMHLPSVIMHEISHVLGLDHPDERPERNLDTDFDPTTPVSLGCRGEARLVTSARINAQAVANGHWTGPGYWQRGLTVDDVAGRDALYPHCARGPMPIGHPGAVVRHGALALHRDGRVGIALGAEQKAAASRDALKQCGADCQLVTEFSQCAAVFRDEGGGLHWSVREDRRSAEATARARCIDGHARYCQRVTSGCAG
jgi:hypothetical protein